MTGALLGLLGTTALAILLVRGLGSRPAGEEASGPDREAGGVSARLLTGPIPEPESLEKPPVPGRFVLQVASYHTRRRAEEVLVRIRAATGLAGAVLPSDVNGERWYRILLGPFPDETEAARAASPLRATGLVGEILVRPIPPGWDAALRPEGW